MDSSSKETPTIKRKRLNEVERLAQHPDPADIVRMKRQKRKGRIPPEAVQGNDTLEQWDACFEDGNPLNDMQYIDPNLPIDDMVSDGNDEGNYLYDSNGEDTDDEEREDEDVEDDGDGIDGVLDTEAETQKNTGNRLVNFDVLKEMIERRCHCASCRAGVMLREITIGIATTVVLTCNMCGMETQCNEAGLQCIEADTVRRGLKEGTRRNSTQKAFRDYLVHYSLVLLMQQLGCGLEGIRAILTHLDLCPTVGNWEKWRELMDTIGETQQEIADECMKKNMKQEIDLAKEAGIPTVVDPTGCMRQGVAASIDMGWQKRSSGNRYDSPSGVSLMIGAYSKKIIQRHVCSKVCRVCDEATRRANKKLKQTNDVVSKPLHRCPKNYEGSSKGMEAHAAVISVNRFYEWSARRIDCTPAFIHTTISDDDSTTWANLQQSFTLRLEKHNLERESQGLPRLTKKDWELWPKTKRGVPRQDNGKLSIQVLAPRINLADPNHRAKVLGKHLYPLTSLPIASGKQISKATAERFKVNFNRAIHQYRGQNSIELRKGLLATLEHEFGNHEHCSNQWCKYLKAKNEDERRDLSARWWDKDKFGSLYDALSAIYTSFLSPEKIEQMNHSHDTQKNESMNKKIARLCPKSMTFSKSMVLSDRVAWAVMEDTLGGAEAVVTLFNRLGTTVVPSNLVNYYTKNDRRRENHHEYTLRKHVKQRRRLQLNTKIWQDRLHAMQDRKEGKDYDSGMAFEADVEPKKDKKLTTKQKRTCAACGLSNHLRRTHKLCPMNKINLGSQKEGIPSGEVTLKDPPTTTTTITTPNNTEIMGSSPAAESPDKKDRP